MQIYLSAYSALFSYFYFLREPGKRFYLKSKGTVSDAHISPLTYHTHAGFQASSLPYLLKVASMGLPFSDADANANPH